MLSRRKHTLMRGVPFTESLSEYGGFSSSLLDRDNPAYCVATLDSTILTTVGSASPASW